MWEVRSRSDAALLLIFVYHADNKELAMIVRNFNDPEVLQTTYRAHYGATARMVLTSQFMKSMEFLAYAMLPAGNVIEEHIDDVEEIYIIAQGGGLMKVGNEERPVKEWDAIWIPAGEPHRLENNTEGMTLILVVAAYPK
jgi:mannose-6-phosphate isomerase-like protein (cupin superfamily)